MTTLIIKKNDEPQPGGVVVIPPPASDEPVIKNTFFFPDIDPKRVREGMRLEQTVAPGPGFVRPSKPASPKPMPSCFCGGNSRLPGVLASLPTCRLTISTARVCEFSITCAPSPQWRPPRSMSVIAAWMPAPRVTRKLTASIPLSTSCGGTCAGPYHASRTNPAAS